MTIAPKQRIRFIVNPIAGHAGKEEFPVFVDRYLDHASFDFEICFTERPGHATELAKEALINQFDVVVAVGGDGTINEVARCLINTTTTFGIIPSGSGNGLARHLNIPLNFEGALDIINQGHKVKIDTVNINKEVFVSIAGVGFDALVAKHFAKDPNRGFFTYFKIVAARYPNYKPKKYTLILDDNETVETEALFISLANSNQFGYNTTIAPDASLNDGMIDVCIVQKPFIFEMPLIINLLFLKMIHKSKYVNIHKAKKVLLIREKNRVINLDGEPIKLKKDLIAEVNPLSLLVIIPKDNEDFNPTEVILQTLSKTQQRIRSEIKKFIK
jgi:diacylglycerol kinase (ATP)